MLFKLRKRKVVEEKQDGLRIQSTVFPEKGQSEWYGTPNQREQLKSVFEKL